MNKTQRNKYNLDRYHFRRNYFIYKLGGKCKHCSTKHKLEFDHIDPSTKKFSISKKLMGALDQVKSEIKKCQLLCSSCHKLKTIEDRGLINARITHGTRSSYRYCKCNRCKEAQNRYMREYRVQKTFINR